MSLSSVGGSAILQQLQAAMFKSADVNNDGQLSSDEFSSVGQNLQSGGNNGQVSVTLSFSSPAQNFSGDTLSSLLDAQHQSHAEKMFASADADGDGKVTAEELTADLEAHAPKDASGLPAASDVAAAMIKDGDTDSDGSLSLDEMKALKPPGGGGHPGAGGPPPSGRAQGSSDASSSSSSGSYDPADANKDGKVSAAELIASLQTASADSADASASSSFGLLAQLLSKLKEGASSTTQAATVTA